MSVPVMQGDVVASRARRPGATAGVLQIVRRLLLGLLLLGMSGAAIELLLLEHVETWQQYVPFVALGLGFLCATAAALRPTRAVLLALRGCMVIFIIAGVAGIYLHYTGNVVFELEMYPGLKGRELLWKSLTGATPVGAPGFLAQLGLLGLVYTYRHPLLSRPRAAGGGDLEES